MSNRKKFVISLFAVVLATVFLIVCAYLAEYKHPSTTVAPRWSINILMTAMIFSVKLVMPKPDAVVVSIVFPVSIILILF